MNQRIIGLDFDDVLVEFNDGLRIFHNNTYGTNYQIKDIVQYELEHVMECTFEESIRRILEFYHTKHHRRIKPVVGAVEAVRKLAGIATLPIVTARPEIIRPHTEELVDIHFGEAISGMYFLGRYGPLCESRKTKGDIAEELGTEVFVEDAHANAIEIAERDIPVLLLKKPWNERKHLPSNVIAVSSWDEALAHLL